MPGDRFIELATSGRRVLDVLFRHASEAVTVQEKSGRLIYANDNAAAMVGFDTGEEMLSADVSEIVARFEMIDRSGEVLGVETLPGRRVLAGEPFVEQVIGYRRPGSPRARWSRVHASPVKNDLGEVEMVINFFLDITEEMRREEARSLLATAYEALGSSLIVERNLGALAGVIVPQVGGWCAVHLVDGANLALVAAVYPETGTGEAFVHLSGEHSLVPLGSDRLQARVASTHDVELITSETPEMMREAEAREGAEFAALVEALQIHSVVCVPLLVRDGVMGTLTVARGHPDFEFDSYDLELLTAVADRAATSLENARLYEREHEMAETLQKGLMPRFLPELPRVDFAARYRPLSQVGHVGGDFYDVLSLSPSRCAVIVGDIAGKGVSASAAVGLARYTLRSTVNLDQRAAVVIGALNEALLHDDPERMCTVAYLLLDQDNERFRLKVALAGHPPPVLLRVNGELEYLGRPCPPAGILPSISPVEDEYWLSPGDIVVVYTDGFNLPGDIPPESINKALKRRHFESADSVLDHMLKLLDDHPEGARDDLALVAFRIRP